LHEERIYKMINEEKADFSAQLPTLKDSKTIATLQDLSREINEGATEDSTIVQDVGVLRIKTANQTVIDACNTPMPIPLIENLWNEGECACCFSGPNVGKSIFAVQYGDKLANSMPVLYCDFELSEKQFQIRYYDDETKSRHEFNKRFYRAEINPDNITDEDGEQSIISAIEQSIFAFEIRVVIIDNLTWICNDSEKGLTAGLFMKQLIRLKKNYDLSILVLAHTPKRLPNSALTLNDLAGSHKLADFFDSVFTMGKSNQGKNFVYLKQLKYRNGAFTYNSDNVLTYEIVKTNSFVHLEERGACSEQAHLIYTDEARGETINQVAELHDNGKSYREISESTGLSLGTVSNYLKKRSSVQVFKCSSLEQNEHLEQNEQNEQNEHEQLPF
jgi:predicted ATP-dependent serine protease